MLKSYFLYFLKRVWDFSPACLFILLFFHQKSHAGVLPRFHLQPSLIEGKDFLPATIVFKLKPAYRHIINGNVIHHPELKNILSGLKIVSLSKLFPYHAPSNPALAIARYSKTQVDLSLIFECTFSSGTPLVKAINRLLQTGLFEYAEPRYLHQLFYQPNDPDLINNVGQYFLSKIKALDAWDINKGDTNVVIGIIDTGTDLDHPDLAGNLKRNYNDPINGIDDDNDGYIDNYYGWDMGANDNDPTVDGSTHGSHVNGCAAAVTDNGTGVASPGFKCKFLPVKIANANGSLTRGYEGIVYAADHGCSVINCSWGGAGAGQFGQDVINYATINKGAVIIAGAGNSNNSNRFYPAAFENAFAVASTNENDYKSGFSNYGTYVDFCAPGSNIYSTVYNDQYTTTSGTSMASPIAAGAVAIIRSHYPAYSGLQAAEKLRATADNIDVIPENSPYIDRMGSGRINMYRALTETTPSIHMNNIRIKDKNDSLFVAGDTITISGNFINYLDPTTNLTATLSSSSSGVTIIDNSYTIGVLNTMGVVTNHSQPFKLVVEASAGVNENILLKVTFNDGAYRSYQFIEITVNVDYINITVNDVKTSITSKGRLCYNGVSQLQGLGFTYKDTNLVYEAGLMLGSSSSQVSDNVRSQPITSTDEDFVGLIAVKKTEPPVISAIDLYGKFTDNGSSSPLPLEITHKAFAWTADSDRKYVVVEYLLTNKMPTPVNDLYAGIFADWDIGNSSLNKANYDAQRKMGYVYDTQVSGLYAGIKLLSKSAPAVHYAIDNEGSGQGGVATSDGYSTDEKYLTLSTNRTSAGNGRPEGNDVIDVMSTGPFQIAMGDSVIVTFALIAGNNLADIQASADAAQARYDALGVKEIFLKPGTDFQVYPVPATDQLHIDFTLSSGEAADISIYNVMGQRVITIASDLLVSGTYRYRVDLTSLADHIYYCRLETSTRTMVKKIMLFR